MKRRTLVPKVNVSKVQETSIVNQNTFTPSQLTSLLGAKKNSESREQSPKKVRSRRSSKMDKYDEVVIENKKSTYSPNRKGSRMNVKFVSRRPSRIEMSQSKVQMK